MGYFLPGSVSAAIGYFPESGDYESFLRNVYSRRAIWILYALSAALRRKNSVTEPDLMMIFC
ncbi:MAG: hypothetical protein NC041_06035 [Bacteroides sp.]|nr:hypothetical protein [Prevotella sp.]MCM1407516.1 hypothetical protein [Treponema brennaborense]MCM1470006.1 hypothetical protein [Bacteroides sp.]